MRKLKLFALFAAMLFATSMWAADPIGCVDAWQGQDGSIYIKGWALDTESPNSTLAIHVYMYKQGQAQHVWSEGNTVANIERPDLTIVGNYGTKHGFERYISTVGVDPGTYWINVYALHAAGTSGGNVRLHKAGTDDQYDFTLTVKSPLTISYNANGGSGAPSSQQKCYGININLQGKGSLARTGYTADGWATSAGGNKAYNFGASYSGNSSTTLYAHWTANQYTVTFDKQGGNGGSNNCTATYNSAMPTISIPGRTGYNFGGYYTAQNGGGTQYIKPEGTSTRNWNIASNTTLYAKWTAKTYTVTFDQQGGTGGSASVTATYDANMPSATMPTRTGYTFQGYYDATSGGTKYYNANGSSAKNWDKASNTTLYARWSVNQYTITFDCNGGSAIDAITQNYGTAVTAPADPTREGYTFAGWDPALPETMPAENMTVVAQWTEIPAPDPEPGDDGKLPGAFTINANGDKVQFSKGNLQATTADNGSTWTWAFATNQYDFIGDAVANNAINGNKSVSANGTVDLFGWSTAATYYGIHNSNNNADYAGDFVDWGNTMTGEWRTLSRAEFRYIVFDRAQAYYKQGKATVNGVKGYIFLPDKWTLPSGLSFTPSPSDYTTNQYDGADWDAMENAGAVFLPAAGQRKGTSFYLPTYGWYWTSTSNEADKAYYLYFYESSRDFVEYDRYTAQSVRLVTTYVAPAPVSVKLYHNFSGDWAETDAFEIIEQSTGDYAKISMILEPGDYEFAVKVGGELRGDGTALSRDNQACVLGEGYTANLTLNVDVKGTYRFYWFYDENRFGMDVPNVCGMYWKNVTDGQFEVTLGQESEVTLPKVWASNMAFVSNIASGVDAVRLVSTDETVATIEYTLSMAGLGTITLHNAGECDIYAVHDITDYYCYDSVAFHLTVHPETEPETPTVWTSLSVGDVIKVGDQLNPSEEWESANDYGVIKPAWAPYTLLRANIAQEHEWDDPVVTEAEDGAYYVFKFTHPTSGTCYLLANSAKSPLLAATATSDGLEVTNVGDDYGTPAFTFAVHEGAPEPGPATAIDNTAVDTKAVKRIANGQLLIIRDGNTYNAQGAVVR